MSEISVQGALEDHPLPRLLIELQRRSFEGELRLTRDRSEARILFHQGAPVQADANPTAHTLRSLLRETGHLEAEAEARVAEVVQAQGCPEGTAILGLKLAKPKVLFGALKEQLRRRIIACFEWTCGAYALDDTIEPPPEAKALRCDPLRIVLDGLVRHWGVERLAEALGPRLALFPVRTPAFELVARRLPDDDVVRSALAACDGTHNLGQVMGAAATQPILLASLWVLDAMGAVSFADAARVEETDDGASPEIEIHVTGGTGSAAESVETTPSAAEATAAPTGARALSPESQTLRDEIVDQHASLGELDYYALLGVEADTRGAAIKKAYFKKAKRFHPDALARMGLADLKDQAGEVFARVSEAYDVLSDEAKRANYDHRLAHGGDEADADRLAQAETFYVKATFLMKMGNFREAHPLLESAVELWADDAAYQSDLGWAFYKKAPSEPARAAEHLEIALALEPDNAEAEFRLGLVRRALEKEA